MGAERMRADRLDSDKGFLEHQLLAAEGALQAWMDQCQWLQAQNRLLQDRLCYAQRQACDHEDTNDDYRRSALEEFVERL
eukprot:2340908-Karenia_brevis.AAC.2